VVRHIDAIGKTDESLIAITMTGRITNARILDGLLATAAAVGIYLLMRRTFLLRQSGMSGDRAGP